MKNINAEEIRNVNRNTLSTYEIADALEDMGWNQAEIMIYLGFHGNDADVLDAAKLEAWRNHYIGK